jgi:C4-type Zn-finger protein
MKPTAEERSITCPSCKGHNVNKKETRRNNGIIGPGYRSWVVDSWYSCLDCGTRFDLVNTNKSQQK